MIDCSDAVNAIQINELIRVNYRSYVWYENN